MLEQIKQEIVQPFYQQNFSNNGVRFVAWYLRRVLCRDPIEVRADIVDGADDKQIDAVVIDNDERRVVIVQGKFLDGSKVDGEPLREVLAAWVNIQDLNALQNNSNTKLKQKIEDIRKALEDEYTVKFELLTTGEITESAKADLAAFTNKLDESDDLSASLHLVDSEVLKMRLMEAEALELPSLNHTLRLDP